MIHVCFLHRAPLAAILGGRKTIEVRLTCRPITPWRRAAPGELVWLKLTGGPLMARAVVTRADYHEGPPEALAALLLQHDGDAHLEGDHHVPPGKRHLSLIHLRVLERVEIPWRAAPDNRWAWITFQDEDPRCPAISPPGAPAP